MNRYVKLPESRFVELFDAERKGKELAERLEAMSCEKVPENMDVGVPEESEAFALADATVHAMDARIRELEAQLADKSRLLSEAKDDAVRFRKGRDDRQAERDRAREKVRRLNAEIARLRDSDVSDDLRGDLQKATVGEFRRLQDNVREATDVIRKIYGVVTGGPLRGVSFADLIQDAGRLCESYLDKKRKGSK